MGLSAGRTVEYHELRRTLASNSYALAPPGKDVKYVLRVEWCLKRAIEPGIGTGRAGSATAQSGHPRAAFLLVQSCRIRTRSTAHSRILTFHVPAISSVACFIQGPFVAGSPDVPSRTRQPSLLRRCYDPPHNSI